MVAHMTEKEARRAGLIKPATKKTRQTAPRQKSESRCTTCGTTFTGETAERRHADNERHHRFEMVL